MTPAITPDERVRAAAINSRPTWAMNFTAGSAAAAGCAAAESHAMHAMARVRVEIVAARTELRHFGIASRRVPKTVDMLCLTPLLPVPAHGRPRPAALKTRRLTLTMIGAAGQRHWH